MPDRAAPCAAAWRRAPAPAGRPGCPRSRCVRPFSLFLIASQFGRHVARRVRPPTSPKTCGWRRTSLSCTAAGHVGQGEPPLLGGQAGVEVRPGRAGRRAPPRGGPPPLPRSRDCRVAPRWRDPDATGRGHARRWPRAPRRTPRAGGGPARRGSARRSQGQRCAQGVAPARRAATSSRGRPARPAAGSTERREVVGLDGPVELLPGDLPRPARRPARGGGGP